MGLNVQIWAMGEAWNQKELDCFTMRRAKKRMALEEEGEQRPGQTELERKLRDTGREMLGKRGANFGLNRGPRFDPWLGN